MQPQGKRQPAPDEAGQLSISISGSPEVVARLIAGMAGSLGGEVPAGEPEQLYYGRAEAARRTGHSEDRLSALVRQGRLTNHGTPGRMLFSLAEIRALADR